MQAMDNKITFDSLFGHLTSTYGLPLLPNPSPYAHEPSLSHPITELSLHPALESILHMLNSDLPAAHFLCRHMQNQPAFAGMFLHGLLHRIEGDYENSKLWYQQVKDSDCFKHVWPDDNGGLDAANNFLNELAASRDKGIHDGVLDVLRDQSRREIEALAEWCKRRFGVSKLEDATDAWVETSEEHRAMAANMIVGGEGWRHF